MIPKASSIYRGSAFADYAEGCSSEGMREVYVRRVDDPKSEKYASGKLRGRQNESSPSYSGSPVPAVTISPTQVAGFSSLNTSSGIACDDLGGLPYRKLLGPIHCAPTGEQE